MPRHKTTPSSSAHIEVRPSGVHGHGVFAVRDLPADTLVGVYAGKRYAAHEAEAVATQEGLTYLFGLSDGSVIDGAEGGNATRHLNHACEPNCEAIEEYARNGKLVVKIHTLHAIAAGQELFLDYALDIDQQDDPSEYPCACGLASCRGTLVAPSEQAG